MQPFVLRYVFVVLLWLGAVSTVFGQSSTVQRDTLRLALAEGIEAVEQGERERAIKLLEPVFVDSSSFVDSEYGSAAYWVGRAYEKEDDMERALRIWRSGILALSQSEQFDARLADTYIHHVFARGDSANYRLAGDAYVQMLRALDTDSLAATERTILVKRLRQLSLILPSNVRRQAGLPAKEKAITAGVLPSVEGERLIMWWRSEDPLPATQINEQLLEHLQRVAHAVKNYPHEGAKTGFDARGDVYVRLGPPDHSVEINYDESRLTDILYQPGVTINLSDFPQNVFWSYGRSIHHRTYYIFVESSPGAPYRIGTVEDLLPRKLRGEFDVSGARAPTIGYASEKRGDQKAKMALATLRTIYRHYAPFHPDFASRHDEVANFMFNAEMEREGNVDQPDYVKSTQLPRHQFIQRTITKHRNQDAVAARRRTENTPKEVSSAERRTDSLGIAVRTAQFLDEKGLTQTEVYWAPTPGAFGLNDDTREQMKEKGYSVPGNYLLRFTAVQQTPDYRDRVINQKRYRIEGAGEQEGTIPAQMLRTQRGDSTLYHLSMQWDQYVLEGGKKIGPKVQMTTERRDSMKTLTTDANVLEMSGIKPVVLPEGKPPLEENSIPYPFTEIAPDTPLALYFEVYHLPLGSNDRTRYTVKYIIEGKADRGKIAEFFRGDDKRRTVVSTTNEGSSRNTEELIRLNVESWDLETETNVTITVQVIDEQTKQRVQRSIDFQLVPAQ